MRLGVPRETVPGERRVALVPDIVGRLVASGNEVLVEAGAGSAAGFTDQAYAEAGASLVQSAADVYGTAGLLCKVQRPSVEELDALRDGTVLVALLQPLVDQGLPRGLAERGVTAFSMDAIPRITRAQPMDALSSQSTVAGYKAVVVAAATLGKFFPMLTTAAGTIAPAKVLVLGAGVAGLQAIATARRLGAVVSTALIPGRPAPVLVTAAAARGMRPGSVIVDLAAEMGGNCELTQPGETVEVDGVTIVGEVNMPSTMPFHASQMYARNVQSFLGLLLRDGELVLDFEDQIVRETCVAHEGQVLMEAVPA